MSCDLTFLHSCFIGTPLGQMVVIGSDTTLYLLAFIDSKGLENEIATLKKKTNLIITPHKSEPIKQIEDELKAYFFKKLDRFKTPYFQFGTPFQKRVWDELKKIPQGETKSYAEIAARVNNPKGYRAVARTNSMNQFAIMIPCHRVINSNGDLGGYAGGSKKRSGFYTMSENRCFGSGPGKEFYAEYHDKEWGVPVYDDRLLFEMLILEGAQAGLSWETILKRREGYRNAFHHFDALKVSKMTDSELDQLLKDEGIIRNRLKIYAARKNAAIFLKIQKEFGSFANYLWKFVDGKPIVTRKESMKDLPVSTKESDALSKDLKKRGMSFVGTTIMYAFMQAVGLVDDHLANCPCSKRSC